MKRFIQCLMNFIIICGFVLFSSMTFAGETDLTTPSNTGFFEIQELSPSKTHTLGFMEDGTLEIDGKPIEKMSDPEIKAAIKEIAAAMKKQTENNELVKQYDRQTGYLLQELEKCLKSK